jgi:hypothetical protein
VRRIIGTIGTTLAIAVSVSATLASEASALGGPRWSADSHEFQLAAAISAVAVAGSWVPMTVFEGQEFFQTIALLATSRPEDALENAQRDMEQALATF